MSLVTRIVARHHVTASNREVLRDLWRRMNSAQRHDPALREVRKQVYREAVAAHDANRALFYAVVTGRVT